MELLTKSQYLKEIKRYNKILSKKYKFIYQNVYKYLDIYVTPEFAMTTRHMNSSSLGNNYNTRIDHLGGTFYQDYLREKFIKFFDVYIEYHYLSNINISKQDNYFNLNVSVSKNGWYDDENSFNIDIFKESIRLNGIHFYIEETDFYYKKYHDKLTEIYELNELQKIKRIFES